MHSCKSELAERPSCSHLAMVVSLEAMVSNAQPLFPHSLPDVPSTSVFQISFAILILHKLDSRRRYNGHNRNCCLLLIWRILQSLFSTLLPIVCCLGILESTRQHEFGPLQCLWPWLPRCRRSGREFFDRSRRVLGRR